MRSLYLRIYLTLVLLLLVFGFGSTWLFQRHIEQERGNAEALAPERLNAMVQLIYRALPPASAPRAEQAAALQDWGQRLRMAIALNDVDGKRIAASERYEQRETEAGVRSIHMPMADGDTGTSSYGDIICFPSRDLTGINREIKMIVT